GIGQRHTTEARQQQSCTGGATDADIAQCHHPARQVANHIHARLQGRDGLPQGHGRAEHHVACPVADLARQERHVFLCIRRWQQLLGQTRVHDGQVESVQPCQRVQGGLTT
ncbi:hypothetical protein RZS08_44525, partial [Arthrospira platensis SPKY1]|nr:hypothetical protein [Arthrospira platensis SPKY1]